MNFREEVLLLRRDAFADESHRLERVLGGVPNRFGPLTAILPVLFIHISPFVLLRPYITYNILLAYSCFTSDIDGNDCASGFGCSCSGRVLARLEL